MARLGIADLRFPGAAFNIATVPAPRPGRDGERRGKFETLAFARIEDRKRAKSAARATSHLIDPAAAALLAGRLAGRRTPRTLASSRYMRRLRKRVIGHVWKLLSEEAWSLDDGSKVAVITVAPRSWEFTSQELQHARAEQLMARLRQWLRHAGAADATGYLLVALHGDFEPNSGVFRLHVHGVATGGMIEVVDRLRTRPDLDARLDPPTGLKQAAPRVEINRKQISNLVYTLTYQLKSYWPSVWLGVVNEDGDVKRSRRPQRIAEPHHTELLLWLDAHALADITLLVKLRVGTRGLTLSHDR